MKANVVDIMLPAFMACLVIVGIHSYLGIHVIKRKVIFVDLALAQIAALGTTVAFLFGVDPNTMGAYWFSLGFTVIGAAIFSISRIRHEKIPQEAIIGLVYAISAAIAILVVDRAPHGAEHIKEIMTGSILWVRWETIRNVAIVYAIVGIFHYLFRDKFLLISNNPDLAYERGVNVRLWDFLFYVSFGIVITHSVGIAGVLLVFVFLVVPAVATIMITDRFGWQLILGWLMGTMVSVVGLLISYAADLPSGPTVVATYGMVLLIHTLILYIVRAQYRLVAARNLALGAGVLLVAMLGFYGIGRIFQEEEHEAHLNALENSASPAAMGALQSDGRPTTPATFEQVMSGPADHNALLNLYNQTLDEFQQAQILKKLLAVDEKEAIGKMIQFLERCKTPFLREEVLSELKARAGSDFGYDSLKSNQENRDAIHKFFLWWKRAYQ